MPIQFVYFDCMDTLIQMDIRSLEIHAQWAYEAAGGLGLWPDGESFAREWLGHRERFQAQNGELREGTIRGRIGDLLREGLARAGRQWDARRIEEETARVLAAYWQRYRRASYVLPEVPECLGRIQAGWEVPFGILSNFMVEGGIPALLADHGLDRFFQVVLVSCDHGYRKPSRSIYQAAIRAAGMRPREILFVGDHPVADYDGPRSMGMAALLYDPKDEHPEVSDRVRSFREIEDHRILSRTR